MPKNSKKKKNFKIYLFFPHRLPYSLNHGLSHRSPEAHSSTRHCHPRCCCCCCCSCYYSSSPAVANRQRADCTGIQLSSGESSPRAVLSCQTRSCHRYSSDIPEATATAAVMTRSSSRHQLLENISFLFDNALHHR